MLTIGLINYLNTQPFQHTLADRLAGADVRFVFGVPTELNRALTAGDVDVAPISSITAARLADKVVIIPGLSIASLGAVKTVLLFSWPSDPRELDGQPVALTDQSATSAALLKVLCRERYGIEPDFRITPQQLAPMLQSHAAALVIGDTALVEANSHRMLVDATGKTRRPYMIDLGDEWLKHTGLPFVFALWAVRRDAVDELLAQNIHGALEQSRDDGLAAVDALAANYAPQLDLPPGLCARYLRDLRYGLTDDDREGLECFLDLSLGASRTPLRYLEAVGAEQPLTAKRIALP
ncbi:MAG: menaquinone biosynthetic enzyme MqnA/MqnD family protein [Anaerolineales bacterium]